MKFCLCFLFRNIYKSVSRIFYILLRSYNLDHRETSFVDITKQKTCVKFKKKILNYVVVGTRQSFLFFGQITWFLENNKNFVIIQVSELVLLNQYCQDTKNQSAKAKSMLTMGAILRLQKQWTVANKQNKKVFFISYQHDVIIQVRKTNEIKFHLKSY